MRIDEGSDPSAASHGRRRAMPRGLVVAMVLATVAACTPAARQPTYWDGVDAIEAGDDHRAMELFRRIAIEKLDTMESALSIDAMNDLRGRVLPEPACSCSAEAESLYVSAESSYQAGDEVQAATLFQRALEACPDCSSWWTHAGDVSFRARDFQAARNMYRHALELDPWNRSALRFLADAEIALGNDLEGYRQLVLAVIADPTYEAGWMYLRVQTERLGGRFARQYEYKPHAVRAPDGKPRIWLGDVAERYGPDRAWMLYAVLQSAAVHEQLLDPKTKTSLTERWRAMSALERERWLVTNAIDGAGDGTPPRRPSIFWRTLPAAIERGFLDEAIFMNLLDAELAGEYREFRRKHQDRLERYVTTMIAVIPSGPRLPLAGVRLRRGAMLAHAGRP